MFIGPPRAGKGVLTSALQQVLGQENCANPQLSKLGETYALQELIGRRAAFINDARIGYRSDRSAIVETLLSISGGDPITISRKYKDAWTGQLSVRFVITTNEIPRLNDDSNALSRRIVPVVFKESFEGRENRGLAAEIAEERLSILHWALDGLARLRKRGRFDLPASATDFHRVLSRSLSGIGAFLADRCMFEPGARSLVGDVYDAYLAWCVDQGIRHPDTKEELGRRLATLGIEKVQERLGGRRPYFYVGIRLALDIDASTTEEEPF